jgi:AGZA family xanthine/uracil permease-like MFS transporter
LAYKKFNINNKEFLSGITTFFTMSYIIVVNPQVISSSIHNFPITAALTSTVLLCFIMTLIAGLFVNLPFAVGPGMGINIFVCYSLALNKNIPWPTMMGLTFISGCLFLILSLSSSRNIIYNALPENLKHGFSCGIGVFLAYIGFKNIGLLQYNPNTIVSLSKVSSSLILGFFAFFVSFFLYIRKKSYAFLFPIVFVTLVSLIIGKISLPDKFLSLPNFSSVFQIDILSALKFNFISIIVTLLLTSLFDSTTTLIALIEAGNFKNKNGNPVALKESFIVNASSSIMSSLLGTTPGLIFLESAAGIEAGAKTGFASIVTAICFIPCLFISPLIGIIPSYATAPILLMVGILMSKSIANFKGNNLDEIIPVFLSIILMPLSSSITTGFFAGIISYIFLKVILGKWKSISLPLYVIGICCIVSWFLERLF